MIHQERSTTSHHAPSVHRAALQRLIPPQIPELQGSIEAAAESGEGLVEGAVHGPHLGPSDGLWGPPYPPPIFAPKEGKMISGDLTET